LKTGISRRLFTLVGILAMLTIRTLAGDGSSIEAALWKWSLADYGTANALDITSHTSPHNGQETGVVKAIAPERSRIVARILV